MTFGAALGSFGQSFAPAAMTSYDFFQKIAQAKMQEEAAKAYGGTLGGMYPMPPPPGTPPQAYGSQPTPPGSPVQQPPMPQPKPFVPGQTFPQPKPMIQPGPMPGPSPMPGGSPQQGQVMPPNMPGPQNPMRDVTPQSAPTGQPPGPSGPMAGPAPQQSGGGGQGPFAGMQLPQVIAAIKQHAPGISDEALGMAVDRFMPMLSADAQYQWRQMVDQREQKRIAETASWHDTRGAQFDRGLDLKAQGMQAVQDRFDARETRIRDRESKTANMRLPPDQEANRKYLAQSYNEAAHTARDAYDNLTRLQSYNAPQAAIDQAKEDYTRADAVRWRVDQDYTRFLDGLKPTAASGKPPAAAPATPTAPAKPAGTPPPPGFKESMAPIQGGEWSARGGNDSTSRGPVVGPTRARPASADVWDSPDHTRYTTGALVGSNSPDPIPDQPGASLGRSVRRAKIANTADTSVADRLTADLKPIEAERQAMNARHSTQRLQGVRSTDAAGAQGDKDVATAAGADAGPQWLWEMKQMVRQFPEIWPEIMRRMAQEQKAANGKGLAAVGSTRGAVRTGQ